MKFDIVIVGGGLAGLSLAVALRTTPLSVAVVEGRQPVRREGWDSRIYAVSPGNERFLAEIGAWQHLDQARIAPVRTMEIYGDAGGRLDFSAFDSGVSELAWIIESSLIQGELWETVKRQGNATLFCPARPEALAFSADRAQLTLGDGRILTADLVVAADGADSWTRSAAGIAVDFKSYGETGVVANFACEKPHRDTAYQWFGGDGVLAWLPLPGNMISMVWSAPDDHARTLLALTPAELCRPVAAAGDHRLGTLSPVTPAAGFPLRLMRAPSAVAPRLALIGDAAHTIHPLSGHGINLGFQDSKALAGLLRDKPEYRDCGDERLLHRYERTRLEEVLALQLATDTLQKLFRPRSAALAMLRNAGLNLTNKLPVVRDALVRYALG